MWALKSDTVLLSLRAVNLEQVQILMQNPVREKERSSKCYGVVCHLCILQDYQLHLLRCMGTIPTQKDVGHKGIAQQCTNRFYAVLKHQFTQALDALTTTLL